MSVAAIGISVAAAASAASAGYELSQGTPDYAGSAAAANAQRQALINQGIQNVNAVYNGGVATVYDAPVGGYDPSKTYYEMDSKGAYETIPATELAGTPSTTKKEKVGSTIAQGGYQTTPAGRGYVDVTIPGQQSQYANLLNAGNLFVKDSTTYGGYQPSFFNQISQNYQNYEVPQLAQQEKQASDEISYGLQNRGITGGSADTQAKSNLALTTGQQEQGIVDTGTSMAQSEQADLTQSKQAVINQLYNSADPAQALQASIGNAAQFTIPSTFTPLTNAFTGLANQYAMSQLFSGTGAGSGVGSFYNFNAPGSISGGQGAVTY